MYRNVLSYEVLLSVLLVTNGAGVMLHAMDVKVRLAGRKRGELQATLSTPLVTGCFMGALVEDQISRCIESVHEKL